MAIEPLLREAITAPVAIALLIGAISAVAILFSFSGKKKGGEEKKPERPVAATLPSDGVFTLDTLGTFNGETGPICLCVCGKVVNVSSSENIRPGEGYGKLWAGKDATYALATLSLKPESANILDYSVNDFTEDQHKALAGWYKHFTSKYPIVGSLKEYEGWDFSSVEKEAESQTPFASSNAAAAAAEPAQVKAEEPPAKAPEAPAGEATPEEEARAFVAAATAANEESGRVMLRAGDRVAIRGLQARPELNGTVGILKTYVADKGRFAVEIEGQSEPILLKPASLTKAPAGS